MKVIEIIEAKRWKHKVTGQRVSPYGHWELVVDGYSWQLDDGTIGLGRPVAKTYEEAVEVMNKVNGGNQ